MDTISVRKMQLLKMLKYVLINFIFLYIGLVFSCEDDLYRNCSDRVAQGGCEVSRGPSETSSFYVLRGGSTFIFSFLPFLLQLFTKKNKIMDKKNIKKLTLIFPGYRLRWPALPCTSHTCRMQEISPGKKRIHLYIL